MQRLQVSTIVIPLLSLLLAQAHLEAQGLTSTECDLPPDVTPGPPRVVERLQLVGGPGTTVASVQSLCGDMTRWLAVVHLPSRDLGMDYGWRVALLADSGAQAVVRFVTHGLVDSHLPNTRLFQADTSRLLLVSMGDEGGSWGMAAYDVGSDMVFGLGILDVGLPMAGDDENNRDALAIAEPEHTDKGWRVGFRIPIVESPNQHDQRLLSPLNGNRVWFVPHGMHWAVEPR